MPAGIAPPAPPRVQDLGKSMIEGHEVEGKRYTLPPPPSSGAATAETAADAGDAKAPAVGARQPSRRSFRNYLNPLSLNFGPV